MDIRSTLRCISYRGGVTARARNPEISGYYGLQFRKPPVYINNESRVSASR